MIIMSGVICDMPTLAERYDKVSNSQFKHGKLLAEYISEIIGNKGHIYSIDPAEYRIQVAQKKESKIKTFPTSPLGLEDVKT